MASVRHWIWVSRLVTAAATIGLCVPALSAAQGRTDTEIGGTVILNGCEPQPQGLFIRATPMTSESAASGRSQPGNTVPAVQTPLEPTDNPRRFTFRFDGLPPETLYRLTMMFPPSACGKVFWKGPDAGIVKSGGDVQIEGLAARARFELLAKGRHRAAAQWLGADHLDLTDPAAMTRRLRWSPDIEGVVGGVIQVSTEQFEAGARADATCSSPKGLIHTASFDAQPPGEWTELPPLDLAQILGGSRTGASDGPALDSASLTRILAGAPIYVRVLPLTLDGPLCDTVGVGLAPVVILASVFGKAGFSAGSPEVIAQDGNQYVPPFRAFDKDHPHLGEYAIRVIEPYYLDPKLANVGGVCFLDSIACNILKWPNSPPPVGSTLQIGERWWLKPPSGGSIVGDFIEGWEELVTAGIDGLGYLVTQASKAWENMKQEVVAVLADALNAAPLGFTCNAQCQGGLKLGLEIGLASMGLPPSLPNWDEVVDRGIDYLAAEVASDITPLPGEEQLVAAAAKAMVQEAVAQMKKKRGSNGHPWLIPDIGVDPAYVVLNVAHAFGDAGLPLPTLLLFEGNDLFLESTAILPRTHWTQSPIHPQVRTLSIPITLRPNLTAFKPSWNPFGWSKEDLAILAKDWWLGKAIKSGCITLDFKGANFATSKVGQAELIFHHWNLVSAAVLPMLGHAFDPGTIQICVPPSGQ